MTGSNCSPKPDTPAIISGGSWNGRSTPSTREPQYQRTIELAQGQGLTTLGLMTNQAWTDDPRHLVFTLARYKFVAKMMSGRDHVLEIGCADAFGTRLVLQEVKRLTASSTRRL